MPRPRVYRTEAIVLRGSNYGEADRILTLLTPRHGKLGAIAKSVRRANSRQGGHLELFNHVEALLAVGRELDVVTQSEVRHSFRSVREDLDRTSHAYYLVEFVDRLVGERVPSQAVFDLCVRGLQALDSDAVPSTVLCQFQLHLLALAGFAPELFHCVACREELAPQVNALSPSNGGVLCPACGARDSAARPISLGAFKLLRHLRRTSLEEGARLRVGQAPAAEAALAARSLAEYVVERRLRSADFIARLSQS